MKSADLVGKQLCPYDPSLAFSEHCSLLWPPGVHGSMKWYHSIIIRRSQIGCPAGLAAIILLWLVYPRQYDFSQLVGQSQLFYDAMKLGSLPTNNPISWRHDALVNAAGPKSQNWSSWAAPNGSIAGGMMTGEIAGGWWPLLRLVERFQAA